MDYDLSKLQLPEHMELDSATLLRQAYQNRSELKKFEKLQEIAKIQTDMAYTGYKPSVALTGSYQVASTEKTIPGPLLIQCANAIVINDKHPEIRGRYLSIKNDAVISGLLLLLRGCCFLPFIVSLRMVNSIVLSITKKVKSLLHLVKLR